MEIVDRPDPKPGPGEVMIRVAYTGICGSDIHIYVGRHPLAKPGMIVGHEFSGTIAELGEGVEGLAVGDKVCAHIIDGCGKCAGCRKSPNLCLDLKVLGTQADGTFAEYVTVKAEKVIKLPEDADMKAMALAEPFAVAVYATSRMNFDLGDTVLVIGAGPIGLCCAIAAEKAGASRVVLSEVVPERIAFARNMGFTVVDSKETPLTDVVSTLADGIGFTKIYETSGVAPSTEVLTKVVAPRGDICCVAFANDARPIDTWNLMRREPTITSIRVHPQSAYEAAIKMMLSDEALRAKLQKLITSDFDFEHIQDAFVSAMDGARNCKVMVKVTD